MALRKIIQIDESKCDGCGVCVPNCAEGALQIIDNKARLISDLFCDGLGSCIGHCTKGAISIVIRNAKSYDEIKVMETHIFPKGLNTIKAHMSHLKNHGATQYYEVAAQYLEDKGIPRVMYENTITSCSCMSSCNSIKNISLDNSNSSTPSLVQWPIQLHLISPTSPNYQNANVLLAADCTAFAVKDFQGTLQKNKILTIACPKLDRNTEIYVEKITQMIDEAKISTLTVAVMQVPCCAGLVSIASKSVSNAKRKIPIKKIILGINGETLSEGWV